MPRQLSDADVDGTLLGQSASDKIGFYGVTPVDQAAHIADVATSTITTAATSTTPWGFATSTQATAVIAIVDDLRTKFNTLLDDLSDIGVNAAS